MTQEEADKIFETDLGRQLEVIYVTSDDRVFIRYEEAVLHTNDMLNADPESFVDTSITEWYPSYQPHLNMSTYPNGITQITKTMKKKILEGNRLIAEFDGRINELCHHNNTSSPYDYDKSWDWLMPVVGKISSNCEEPEELDGLKYALLSDDIETAWEFIVDRLKFKTNDNTRVNN